MKELQLPVDDLGDPKATEFLRAWLKEGDIYFASLGNIWEDAGQIGIFLADLLRHLVDGSDAAPHDKAEQLQRAAKVFALEMEST